MNTFKKNAMEQAVCQGLYDPQFEHDAVGGNAKTGDGESGKVKKIITSALDWNLENRQFTELQNHTINADLVLLAIGFKSNEKCEILNNFQIVGSFSTGKLLTEENQKAIFTADDVTEGPSLVVNAIYSGRKVAEEINEFLSY